MTDTDYFLTSYKTAAADIARSITRATDVLATPFDHGDPLKQESVRFITEGGKRLRPALSLVVTRAFGHDDIFPHLALETFHKYLLAHDDIIDRDDMRYGAPTVHAKLRQLHTEADQHFGNSLAIISGDLMEAATTKIILTSNLRPKTKIALQHITTCALEEVAWGWYDQFLMDYLPLNAPNLNFKRIEKSIIWVTGKYSVKLPLFFGFTIAGRRIPRDLESLADTMGALYQTGDDLMGLFGQTEDTGKSNHGDITQGKKTLPLWLAYEGATVKDKNILCSLVGKKDLTLEQIDQVRAIIKRSGGLRRSKQLMGEYRDSCLQNVKKIRLPQDLKRFLQGFIYFLEHRDR